MSNRTDEFAEAAVNIAKVFHASRSPDDVIKFMNELLSVDAQAVYALVEQRVPCNKAMADHPTVQVTDYGTDAPKVGLLGILNGLFGVDEQGWGPIAAVFEDDGTISKFERSKTFRTTITVNGKEHVVAAPTLSYEEVVDLAGLVRGRIYSMTYSGGGLEGTLIPGKSTNVVAGMHFGVYDTGNA